MLLLSAPGDWVLLGADGFGRLDVRATFESDDGALIYVAYQGLVEFNERTMAALGGGQPLEYGDVKFISQPRFETGDERYAWLNTTVAVAEGRLVPGAVEYQVYEVVQG